MIRDLAILLFRHSHRFLRRDCLKDFAAAKGVLSDIIYDPHSDVRAAKSLLGTLDRLSSWGQFFDKLCGHDLFTDNTARPTRFVELWQRIAGFDADGLLEIGQPSGRTDPFLARHHLGNLLGKSWFGGASSDDHAHYGQYVDMGLLWHFILGNNGIHPGSAMGAHGDSGRLGDFQAARWQRYADWQEGVFLGQVLLSVFGAESGSDDEDALAFFFKDDRPWSGFPERGHGFASQIQRLTAMPPGKRILLERRLFALVREDARTPRHQLARAYTIAKNAAFHRLLSNSVTCFEGFSRSLAILKAVYGQARTAMADVDNLDLFARHLEHSRSVAPAPRFLLRKKDGWLNRLGEDAALCKARLRSINGATPPEIALAFHREDFEKESAETLSELRERILRDHGDWGLAIVGVDLVGPEARSQPPSADRPPGGTSEKLLLDAVDYVFDLRRGLEAGPNGRQLFATFHAGEHVANPIIGVVGILVVLADNRFRPDIDRISHGLVLKQSVTDPQSDLDPSLHAIDCTIGHLLTEGREKYWDNGLFSDGEIKTITGILDEYRSQTRRISRFQDICDIIAGKIGETLMLEVCPFSNHMIEKVDLTNHLWAPEYKSGRRLLVGTDDPSLTQTLPWMERAFLSC